MFEKGAKSREGTLPLMAAIWQNHQEVMWWGAVPPFLIDLNQNESCPPLHRAKKWCPRRLLKSNEPFFTADHLVNATKRRTSPALWVGQINVTAAFKTPPAGCNELFGGHLLLEALHTLKSPRGGGLEYLPASCRRRRKGNPVPGGITGSPCSWGI
jgi:hypothetical protein